MRFEPITRNNDFIRAYKRGKAFVSPQLVLYVNKTRTGKTRVGITATKKVGKAVQRNRARRVLRHALYQVMPVSGIGSRDIVLVARGATPYLKSTKVAQILVHLFQQAGLTLKENALEENA